MFAWVTMMKRCITTRSASSSICKWPLTTASFALCLTLTHRCFYLDSPSNACELGLPVKSKNEADVDKRSVFLWSSVVVMRPDPPSHIASTR